MESGSGGRASRKAGEMRGESEQGREGYANGLADRHNVGTGAHSPIAPLPALYFGSSIG